MMLFDFDSNLAEAANAIKWHPSKEAAFERLNAFIARAGKAYAAKRNFDYGPENRSNVSGLSPWVRHRLILEQDILKAVFQKHNYSTAEKFIQEVFWRTYFKGWLEQHPSVWVHYNEHVQNLVEQLEQDNTLHRNYSAAVNGETGIECFDAWAKELVDTGYLHNHTRMWFASIWIFTLRLPWQLGADFFYRHLLDGDPASNTLSWRWVAGLHTKGKTYLARASNIARYTEGRFNPVNELAKQAPALVEVEPSPLIPMPQSDRLLPNEKFGLLITEEDCSAETLILNHPPVAALGIGMIHERSPLPISALASNFAKGSLTNALERISKHHNVEAKVTNDPDFSKALVTWAQRNNISTLVTAYTPVGPTATKLNQATDDLSQAGITLKRILRPYDTISWTFATKGFFKLKAKIPEIVSHLKILSSLS